MRCFFVADRVCAALSDGRDVIYDEATRIRESQFVIDLLAAYVACGSSPSNDRAVAFPERVAASGLVRHAVHHPVLSTLLRILGVGSLLTHAKLSILITRWCWVVAFCTHER